MPLLCAASTINRFFWSFVAIFRSGTGENPVKNKKQRTAVVCSAGQSWAAGSNEPVLTSKLPSLAKFDAVETFQRCADLVLATRPLSRIPFCLT